jgi:two-component system sensor histidine kinase UhpB
MYHHPARAMYDRLEDTLSSITMQLRSAIAADASMPPQADGKGGEGQGPFHRPRGWARQVAGEIGSVLLHSLGLAATIEWHVRQFQSCTGVPCDLTVTAAAGIDLPVNCADTIFDIYSEALSNIARHAKATRVAIALTITAREVTLVVRDNGIGIGIGETASRAGRSGISGMRARAQVHKGFCEFAAAQSGGTTVTASLPVARVR